MATKGRSPNYPSINLRDALERARLIYSAEHRTPTHRPALAEDLGYQTLNGASSKIIGALRRYGILEKHEGGLRISADAVSFFELPPREKERTDAIERLAYTPKLFQELKDQYPDEIPSDATVRYYLINKTFLPKAADDVVRIYRDTVELVLQEQDACSAKNHTDKNPERADPESTTPSPPREETPIYMVPKGSQEEPNINTETGYPLQFPLSENSKVQILFSGPITQEDVETVKSYLDVAKKAFPARPQSHTSEN